MAKKIKILYIISSVGVGGAEDFLLEVTSKLNKNRFVCTVCAIRKGGKLLTEFKKRNVKVKELTKSYFNFIWIFRLLYICFKEKPDIIHTYLYMSNVFGRLVGILCRVPVIVVSEVANDSTWKKWYHRIIDRMLIPFTDKFIVDGHAVKKYYIEKIKIPRSKIILIHTTVDDKIFFPSLSGHMVIRNEFNINSTKKIVGFIGRLHPQKGVEYFLKAAQLVLSKKII